jgi:hypothetical protein
MSTPLINRSPATVFELVVAVAAVTVEPPAASAGSMSILAAAVPEAVKLTELETLSLTDGPTP